jgi:hypothetical protein
MRLGQKERECGVAETVAYSRVGLAPALPVCLLANRGSLNGSLARARSWYQNRVRVGAYRLPLACACAHRTATPELILEGTFSSHRALSDRLSEPSPSPFPLPLPLHLHLPYVSR